VLRRRPLVVGLGALFRRWRRRRGRLRRGGRSRGGRRLVGVVTAAAGGRDGRHGDQRGGRHRAANRPSTWHLSRMARRAACVRRAPSATVRLKARPPDTGRDGRAVHLIGPPGMSSGGFRPQGSGMAEPQERDLPSREDEIFAVAHRVEVEPAAQAHPRLPAALAQVFVDRARAFLGRDVKAVGDGFGMFLFVDAVMLWAPLMMSRRPSLMPQFITLLVLAFGLGGLLVVKVGGRWRTFGFGMMLAWGFLTLVSVGFLTGLTAL